MSEMREDKLKAVRRRAHELFEIERQKMLDECSGMAEFCFDVARDHTMAACYEQALRELEDRESEEEPSP